MSAGKRSRSGVRARTGRWVSVGVVAVVLLAACTSTGVSDGSSGLEDPGDCVPVDMVVSSEKLALLTDLAHEFNDSPQAELGGGECGFVRVRKVASGAAATLLANGWPDRTVNGEPPTVWSPAASSWGAVLNQRLAEKDEPEMAPASDSFMVTPLVIAMPKPMAEALGWPKTPIGWEDVLRLSRDPAGWAAYGHPEWGAFKLGKTNPNYSTSGLHARIAQYYAATGKTSDLTLEDVERPEVEDFARGIESAVVHYGDISLTFLNNLYRNDARGTALTYVSAVAVEEKSVLDYNRGNPDGILDPGETARAPRVPLVAVYPKEGTVFSDNPFIVLDAPWVTAPARTAARRFETFIQRPIAQRRALRGGFRPGNSSVPVGNPINAANGLDPNQPQTLLEVPKPDVLTRVLDKWEDDRKRARVLLLLDVSGSMGEPAGDGTKLDLAKQAAIDSLALFADDDEVGLRIFSTGLGPDESNDWLDLVPVGPFAGNRELIAQRIDALTPVAGTPLYTSTRDAYNAMIDGYDEARINAVVLLTDGRNEDDRNTDLDGLLKALRAQSTGEQSKQVRVFAIAYGEDADLETLRRMADATNAQVYDASDPTTISAVFTSVVSNF